MMGGGGYNLQCHISDIVCGLVFFVLHCKHLDVFKAVPNN